MMTSIAATLLRAAACGVFLSAGLVGAARAQAPRPAAPDPAFEAAKRAFEALPEMERRALQDALVWTGNFNAVVSGAFGPATRAGIVAFAKGAGLPADGVLDDKGRDALKAAGAQVKARVGFAPTRDPRTGANLGLPLKILARRVDTPTGSRWTAADNAVTLETFQAKESDGDLQAWYDQRKDSTPERKVTYKLLRPDFFVISGEIGKNTFYTRMARGAVNGAGVLRGYTLAYPATAKGNDRVSIAVANAFDPFPGAAPAVGVATAPTAGGTQTPTPPARPPGQPSAPPAPRATIVASAVAVGADRVVTALGKCDDPKVGARPARIVRQDGTTGLMLLEAQGLGARPLAPVAAPGGKGGVVVLYQAARSVAAGAAPVADAMAASGEILTGGKGPRVLAPLQEQAAGGAVFDRDGSFVALVGAGKPLVRVAGVVPQTAWPLVEAPALAAFLAANGVAPQAATAVPKPKNTADISAMARGALWPVVCTQ